MSEEFNPRDHERPPRSEGYREETEEICEIIKSRGDQRIGQLILNAVRAEYGDGSIMRASEHVWNLEAPELLDALKQLEEKTRQ